jgi:hypothetical protein
MNKLLLFLLVGLCGFVALGSLRPTAIAVPGIAVSPSGQFNFETDYLPLGQRVTAFVVPSGQTVIIESAELVKTKPENAPFFGEIIRAVSGRTVGIRLNPYNQFSEPLPSAGPYVLRPGDELVIWQEWQPYPDIFVRLMGHIES